MCSAVNEIDMSALESLEKINTRLNTQNIQMHLSEVKGLVMDRLRGTHFIEALTGDILQSQFEAIKSISPDVCMVDNVAHRNTQLSIPALPWRY